MTALRQRTPEWVEAKRRLISSTDIPVILGLSPYRSEGQLAREKLGVGESQPSSLVMRIGAALEPVIAEQYEIELGFKLVRYRGIVKHPQIEWAAASPDFRRKGARYLVETKNSESRRWDGDEVPQDVEAQVRWALGCTGYAIADVALLHYGKLRVFTIEHEQSTFDGMVGIAAGFRRRMVEGGPFEESVASLKTLYPRDDGTEIKADADVERLVAEKLKTQALLAEIEKAEEKIDVALKGRLKAVSRVVGSNFTISYKRQKDSVTVAWPVVAEEALRQLPEAERADLIAKHTSISDGARPLRVFKKKEKAA